MSRILEALGSSVRAMICAPEGKALVVSDLSSIEVWVLGWLTDCEGINQMAREGKDPYKAFAEIWLEILYDQVDKPTRNLCKPPMLGCGYRLGPGEQDPEDPEKFTGLMAYGRSMGVELDQEQARHATEVYREKFWEVPNFWKSCERASYSAVCAGETATTGPLTWRREGDFLTIELPSTRKLYYHLPDWRRVRAPWADKTIRQWIEAGELPDWLTELSKTARIAKAEEILWRRDDTSMVESLYTENLTYMGEDQYANQWARLVTHGGKITENVVQAIARDILLHGMRLYEFRSVHGVIGHVHDEAIAETPEDRAAEELALLDEALRTTPSWAPGLILGSEGYIAKRYRKG